MQHFRDVDRTVKWMHQSIKEEMIVPALSQAIIAEIEAQAAHIAQLESTISAKSLTIRTQEGIIEGLHEDVATKEAKIQRMKEVVITLGIKSKVIEMLQEEF